MSDGTYASGKNSRFICERCGFEGAYKDSLVEPGTNLRVDRECFDGHWNRVDHPQNHPPHDLQDAITILDPAPDPEDETKGISFYGETSSGFATQYVGDVILVPEEIKYPLKRDFSHQYALQGINASCRSGDATLSVLIAGTTVKSNIEVNSSSRNTALSGIINVRESLEIEVVSNNDSKSLNVAIAYIRSSAQAANTNAFDYAIDNLNNLYEINGSGDTLEVITNPQNINTNAFDYAIDNLNNLYEINGSGDTLEVITNPQNINTNAFDYAIDNLNNLYEINGSGDTLEVITGA